MSISVVGTGAYAFGTGPITPSVPFGVVPDDILVFVGESDDGDNISASGWSSPTDSPVNQPADEGTRLTILWRRAISGSNAFLSSDSGNHQSGRIIAFRGCKKTGSPWNITQSTTGEGSSISLTGDTTTADNCMILAAISGASQEGDFSGWTNSNLSSFAERFDNRHNSGNGGCVALATGLLAAAGGIGNTTANTDGDEEWAGWIGALEPEPEPSEESSEEEPSEESSEEASSEESSEESSGESSEESEEDDEVPHSNDLGIDTFEFDSPEPILANRDPIEYYLAWQMMDNGSENRDKHVRTIRMTGKGKDLAVQIHAASPGDEIDREAIEDGTEARYEAAFDDTTQVTRYAEKKVSVKNLSIWTVRYSGVDDGQDAIRDRLDELVLLGDAHGTRR